MKNKKLLGITAALAVTVLTGGSLAIFAAETVIPDAEIVEAEPETAAPVVEETEAAPAVSEAEADDADYSYHVGQQCFNRRGKGGADLEGIRSSDLSCAKPRDRAEP